MWSLALAAFLGGLGGLLFYIYQEKRMRRRFPKSYPYDLERRIRRRVLVRHGLEHLGYYAAACSIGVLLAAVLGLFERWDQAMASMIGGYASFVLIGMFDYYQYKKCWRIYEQLSRFKSRS